MTRKFKVYVVCICASQCIFIEQHFRRNFPLFLHGEESGVPRARVPVASLRLPLDLPSVSLCPLTDGAVGLVSAQCGIRLPSLKSGLCLLLAV